MNEATIPGSRRENSEATLESVLQSLKESYRIILQNGSSLKVTRIIDSNGPLVGAEMYDPQGELIETAGGSYPNEHEIDLGQKTTGITEITDDKGKTLYSTN
jgi:hypothetical protein